MFKFLKFKGPKRKREFWTFENSYLFRISNFALRIYSLVFRNSYFEFLILPLLSGLLTGLSFHSQYPYLSFLIWFSLIPFIYVIYKSSIKKGIFYAFVFGLVFYGTTIFWIGNVTILGLILLLIYLSIYPVLFFILGKYLIRKSPLNPPFTERGARGDFTKGTGGISILSLFTMPSLWIILEFLKENIWCGFGWGNLGYSQFRHLHFIQTADLFGTKFISFIIVLVNVLIFDITVFRKNIIRNIIFVFCVFALNFVYSQVRLNNLKADGNVAVSVIQPNISQELKWYEEYSVSILTKLINLGDTVKGDRLLIYPEASWPAVVDKNNFVLLQEFAKQINKNILIGAVEERGSFYNNAFYFDKEGEYSFYHKIKLVPFGEYVPLRNFLNNIPVINSIGDMERGSEFVQFLYKGKYFSVLICFEDISPLFVVKACRGRDFLVNITNDAWFGGEPEAGQHFGIMTMRAIENRISIVRSANTGISGWVSFKGGIEVFKENNQTVNVSGAGNFNVLVNKERSFYNRYGEFFPLMCVIFLLVMEFVRRWDIFIVNKSRQD